MQLICLLVLLGLLCLLELLGFDMVTRVIRIVMFTRVIRIVMLTRVIRIIRIIRVIRNYHPRQSVEGVALPPPTFSFGCITCGVESRGGSRSLLLSVRRGVIREQSKGLHSFPLSLCVSTRSSAVSMCLYKNIHSLYVSLQEHTRSLCVSTRTYTVSMCLYNNIHGLYVSLQ
jgi:hypothetical protein